MNELSSPITRRQEQAIATLLTQPTLAGAATAAGVGVATLTRWLRQPAFARAYRDARHDAVAQASSRLAQASSEAVDTLRTVMLDTMSTPSARVTAAKAILEMAYQAVEVDDLMGRVDSLPPLLSVGTYQAASAAVARNLAIR